MTSPAKANGDRELISSDRRAPPSPPPHALVPRGARHVFIYSSSLGIGVIPEHDFDSGHVPSVTVGLGRRHETGSRRRLRLCRVSGVAADRQASRRNPSGRAAALRTLDPKSSSIIRAKGRVRGRRGGNRAAAPTPVSANTTLGQGVDNNPPPPTASLIRPGVTSHKHGASPLPRSPRSHSPSLGRWSEVTGGGGGGQGGRG